MTMVEALYTFCAGLYLALAVVVIVAARPGRTEVILAAGCLMVAAWAAASAYSDLPSTSVFVASLELAVSVAWYGFVLHLYYKAVDGGVRLRQIFTAVGMLAAVVVAVRIVSGGASQTIVSFGSVDVDIRLGLAVCTVLLIENLYRNATADLRWHIALPCIAVSGLCIYSILFTGDAVLFRRVSPILSEGRPVVALLIAPLFALSIGRNRRRWGVNIQVSRTAVLHTASLVIVGVFLLALAAVGETLRLLGSERQANWAMVVEVGLVCGGLLAACVFLTSGSARSNLRSLIVDNFFAQRYDYRIEWLRCIATLSQPGNTPALHTRAVRALAQIVDSPSGLLFLRDADGGVFRWAGSWNLPPITVEITQDHPLPPLFRGGRWVVQASETAPWIEEMADLWLAIPLSHAGRLTGFALVSKPRAAFTLDREVFDLLRIVGQEVASHVAEQQAAESLLQSRQLREYGQRFAFVAHDIKNVASQLALLLSNAEHHISNPEFQQDMLGTVSGSVQKITILLARLKTPDAAPVDATVTPAARIAAIVAAREPGQRNRIRLVCTGPAGSVAPWPDPLDVQPLVRMPLSAFDAVLAHLLDNAFDASAASAELRIELRQEDQRLRIDIVDHGTGMSPEFVRDRLFHPFSSSKRDGFGLGVYQARELLRQSGGDLLVISVLGSGTTMRLSLPAVGVAGLTAPRTLEPASEPAAGGSR